MSEASPNPLESLQPGDVIEFADITELPAFEDMVAAAVDPDMFACYSANWAGRVPLREFIRPPNFNGTIADIRLEVMDQPYERLLDARERGWRLDGSQYERFSELGQQSISHYRGFTLMADAKSSGRGIIGHMQTELWYYPLSAIIGKNYNTGRVLKSLSANGGLPIRRVVAKPKIGSETFIALNEHSRQIGFTVLRQAMQHPITQPMRQ